MYINIQNIPRILTTKLLLLLDNLAIFVRKNERKFFHGLTLAAILPNRQ
jgi:hypothetical protein